MRLLVAMIVVVPKSMHPRGNLTRSVLVRRSKETTYMRRQIAPALLLVPFFRICKSGPAAELMTWLISPATKSSTTKKTDPVNTPIRTQVIMILGPCLEGLGISITVSITSFRSMIFDTFNHMCNAILGSLAVYRTD